MPIRPPESPAPAVVISNVQPAVECGRYPVKRVAGESLRVEADIFKDGHDEISAALKWRRFGAADWNSAPMGFFDNDRWQGEIAIDEIGDYEFTVEAWPDSFRSWKKDFRKRVESSQQDLRLESIEGAELLEKAATRAKASGDGQSASQLASVAETMLDIPPVQFMELLFSDDLQHIMDYWPDKSLACSLERPIPLWIERRRAQFSAWYEFFPRSARGQGEPSTFRDCLPRLDDAAAMGFDVVYLPPIHPIGVTARKGANNAAESSPGEPGSPWAIGSSEGGHYAVEPALGTLDDFRWLIGEARQRGLEMAIDFAINCSPDHPYVRQHPEWFHHRPDGAIKYAENPPKKYQDIYPLNFHCEDWKNLWQEMCEIVRFWAREGIRIFRVDNPHTKPVSFWEYLIREIRREFPEVIFLSEAFTRPKMMQALAKAGFQQSYTYFTWRVEKDEIIEYLTELTRGPMRNYFRANFWPNTPDILAFHLQGAGPNQFKARAALAALLSPSWGMYSGYEFCENEPLGPGREEYLNSEKYQVADRDWSKPVIADFIAALNRIRRENPAMREYANLRFIRSLNSRILAWCRTTADRSNRIVVVVSLEPDRVHEDTIFLPLRELELPDHQPFAVTDLITSDTYTWRGSDNYVRLEPGRFPVHVFRV